MRGADYVFDCGGWNRTVYWSDDDELRVSQNSVRPQNNGLYGRGLSFDARLGYI